ncbi:DNA-binding protein RHL1 isoform X2 [Senna tora]|uniref:DNA-binding protein RHL1 isoform X2 n=1 Tax=Senna tora TaxID=362788 RepID=A0A834T1C2_9FABA|nr:DNA-binding protein RHL1 isoform X2 [Senna tora]
MKDTKEVVPVRHSERTAGKAYKYKFAEISSGDDSPESSPDLSEQEEKKENQSTEVVDDDNKDAVEEIQLPKENKMFASGSLSKKTSQFASTTESKEVSTSNRGSLVQATISTLFKKVEEKKAPRTPKKPSSSKDSSKKVQLSGSKRNIDQNEGSRKRVNNSEDKDQGEYSLYPPSLLMAMRCKKMKAKGKKREDIEESDEDWTA